MKDLNEQTQKEIEAIIKTSGSPDEALSNICKAFPEVDYELLKKNYDEEIKKAEISFSQSKNSEVIQNLSENELESVAGGSFGSWMKKNWPIVLGLAAIATVGIVCWKKGYFSKASGDKLAEKKVDGKTDGAKQVLTDNNFDFSDYYKYGKQ